MFKRPNVKTTTITKAKQNKKGQTNQSKPKPSEFKIILGYIMTLQSTWASCWILVSKRKKGKDKKVGKREGNLLASSRAVGR